MTMAAGDDPGGAGAHQAKSGSSPPREVLRERLRERNRYPERAAEIERELMAAFQRRRAILALDMVGFSRLTHAHGALFYLAMIVQMEEAATPPVLNNRGRVVKQEADNLFAVFDSPSDALEAALDIILAIRAVNNVVPNERDIGVSIGIGYGDVLDLGDDVFGDEMNVACRLGEDLAGHNEILITPAAHAALPADEHETEQVEFPAGEHAPITAFRWRGRANKGAPNATG
jgi:class 3 adenylate cyclase